MNKDDRLTLAQLQLLTDDQLLEMTDRLCIRFHQPRSGTHFYWVKSPCGERVFRPKQKYAVRVIPGEKATVMTVPGGGNKLGCDFTQAEINYLREHVLDLCPGTRCVLSTNGLDVPETPRFRARLLGLVVYRIITGVIK